MSKVSIDFPVMLLGWTLKLQALGVFRLSQGNVELSLEQLPFETKTALLFGSEVGKMFSSWGFVYGTTCIVYIVGSNILEFT